MAIKIARLMNDSTSTNRLVSLDMLRGVAALLVVLFHLTSRYADLYRGQRPLLEFSVGHVGVHIFFIISGYVIFTTLERTGTGINGVLNFAWARVSRLYPVFWVSILITSVFILALGLPGREVDIGDTLINFTMIPRLLGADYVDGVYWSLEVEVLFYLGAALMFYMAPSRWGTPYMLTWVLIGRLILIIADKENSEWIKAARILFIADWIPFFAFGAAIYWYRKGVIGPRMLSAFALIFLWSAIESTTATERVVIIAGALCILRATRPDKIKTRTISPLVWLGAISYPLYLIHQNIGYAILLRMMNAGIDVNIAIIITLLVVIAAAALLNRYVERPSMSWLRYRRERLNRANACSWRD